MALDASVATAILPGGWIAVNFTPDISAGSGPTASTGVMLGRTGLPDLSTFYVQCTTAGGGVGATVHMHFALEVSTDNGGNYYPVGVVTLLAPYTLNSRGAVRVGLTDIRPEGQVPTTLLCRISATWTQAVGEADDPVFQAYLTGPQSTPNAPYV